MTVRTQVFSPVLNYTITGTNSSVAQAISQPPGTPGSTYNAGGYTTVRFYNPNAYVAFASWVALGTATASTSGNAPIPASGSVTYDMGGPMSSIAVILGTASAGSIYVSVGDGGP